MWNTGAIAMTSCTKIETTVDILCAPQAREKSLITAPIHTMNMLYGVVTLNDNITISLHSPGLATVMRRHQYVTVCNVYRLFYHKMVEKSRIKKQNALGYLKRPKIRFSSVFGLPGGVNFGYLVHYE